ncbi:DNA helicase RecQ, partial [candidate division KSB1 bacterium]|nr:DNA helicase RecQ [candidate division KSB1 bacterium]NIS25997.1 DNA helicase RecQ [candidate division KSB1 bacterium]NIU26662.1 DNA helicase RecQ [candidate division KSB1 bacterium]
GLLQMHGVGVSKMEKYGTIFLKIIRAYCREKNISERLDETNEAPSQNHPRASSSLPRYFAVGDAFNAGKSVDELARTYGVTQQTILDHIYRYYQAGYPL